MDAQSKTSIASTAQKAWKFIKKAPGWEKRFKQRWPILWLLAFIASIILWLSQTWLSPFIKVN